jgi:exodeoxyribonuclease III
VRVVTFNINNINKRLDNLLAWLTKAEPDVVSLQELKAEQEAFPVNGLRTLGYEAVWQGERSWNGVAILARHHVPVLTCTSLPGNSEDHQARYIEAAVQGVLITSIYLPNGNPQPGRNSITNWHGLSASLPTPPNSWRAAHPWSWPVTTMSCRHCRTSIRLDRWITTR